MSHKEPTPRAPVPPGWCNQSWLASRYEVSLGQIRYWLTIGVFDDVPRRLQGERKRSLWLKSMLPSRFEIDQRISALGKNQGRPHVASGKPVVPSFLEL